VTHPTPYDHARKIGNKGDLVKHAALANILATLVQQHHDSVFVYAETNAGRPNCVLPSSGEWSQKGGAGKFSKSRLLAADRQHRRKSEPARFPALTAYDELALLCSELKTGCVYPGSSELAFRALRCADRRLEFHLWERGWLAHDDLKRHYLAWPEVRVRQEDGYAGVAELLDRSLSFVLIDPPDTKSNHLVEPLLAALAARRIPFLCWTPTGGTTLGPGMPPITLAGHFPDLLKRPDCQAFVVRWSAWGPFSGCQLTVLADIEPLARAAVDAVCAVMNNGDDKTPWAVEAAS
jgi:23S rRNA A2030 N6-methylase RlmJ